MRFDLVSATIGDHAREQMLARFVSGEQVRKVLSTPETVLAVRPGRVVAQRIIPRGTEKPYLLRVFVDVDRSPPAVVTVYWTSRLEKYRGLSP